MDFMSRGGQARTNNTSASATPAPAAQPISASAKPANSDSSSNKTDGQSKWTRIGFLILLFAGTILVVATLLFLAFGKGTYGESQLVDKGKLQAVFINVNGTNGGQVYFGNVTDLTPSYIRLENVYYIQNQQANAQDNSAAYNLVKLGCELHGPEDMMVINRSEVFFWENLKTDSQVAQKVAEFRKQNPEGQKCNTANQGAQPSGQQSGNTQQPAPANTNNTAPKTPTPAPATNNNTNQTQNDNDR